MDEHSGHHSSESVSTAYPHKRMKGGAMRIWRYVLLVSCMKFCYNAQCYVLMCRHCQAEKETIKRHQRLG